MMRTTNLILMLLLMLIVWSCKNGWLGGSGINKTDSLIIPTDSNALYLPYPPLSDTPSKSFSFVNKKRFDTTNVQICSYFLFKFNEPLLSNYDGKKAIYRFTCSPSFSSPICIRIENNNGKIKLIKKELTGKGGYEIGSIAIDTTVNLTQQQWDNFIALVNGAKFWEMHNNDYEFGFDGATWLLEGVDNEKYNWVYRWSPGEKSLFGKACHYLVSISPIKVDSTKIY